MKPRFKVIYTYPLNGRGAPRKARIYRIIDNESPRHAPYPSFFKNPDTAEVVCDALNAKHRV